MHAAILQDAYARAPKLMTARRHLSAKRHLCGMRSNFPGWRPMRGDISKRCPSHCVAREP